MPDNGAPKPPGRDFGGCLPGNASETYVGNNYHEDLKSFRSRIDELDNRIVDLLAARTDIIREVGRFKFDNNIPAVLQNRVDDVLELAAARAESKGLDPGLIRDLYCKLIDYSCNLEEEIKQELVKKIET